MGTGGGPEGEGGDRRRGSKGGPEEGPEGDRRAKIGRRGDIMQVGKNNNNNIFNRLSQSLTHVRANIKHYYLISQLYNYYNTIHFFLVILRTGIFFPFINVLYI